MSSAHFVPLLLAGLFAWSIYRRVRRNIGRQRLHPRRAITSIIILSVVSILIISTSLQNTHLLLGFGGGLLPGILLGFVGLRLTRFETAGQAILHAEPPHRRRSFAAAVRTHRLSLPDFE